MTIASLIEVAALLPEEDGSSGGVRRAEVGIVDGGKVGNVCTWACTRLCVWLGSNLFRRQGGAKNLKVITFDLQERVRPWVGTNANRGLPIGWRSPLPLAAARPLDLWIFRTSKSFSRASRPISFHSIERVEEKWVAPAAMVSENAQMESRNECSDLETTAAWQQWFGLISAALNKNSTLQTREQPWALVWDLKWKTAYKIYKALSSTFSVPQNARQWPLVNPPT